MSGNTINEKIKRDPIDNQYEWVIYNDDKRFARSVTDGMIHMKSVVDFLTPQFVRDPKRWLDLDSTKDMIKSFSSLTNINPVDQRMNLHPKIKGYYLHQLLVPYFAMWISSSTAPLLSLVLSELNQRTSCPKVDDSTNHSQSQSQSQANPRPLKFFKFMIYTVTTDDEDMIELHLVRRNARTFSSLQSIANSDRCFYYRKIPPTAYPCDETKSIIKQYLPGQDYNIKGSSILTHKQHLPLIKSKLDEYFEKTIDQ